MACTEDSLIFEIKWSSAINYMVKIDESSGFFIGIVLITENTYPMNEFCLDPSV